MQVGISDRVEMVGRKPFDELSMTQLDLFNNTKSCHSSTNIF
jgi:hypothetical protein